MQRVQITVTCVIVNAVLLDYFLLQKARTLKGSQKFLYIHYFFMEG